MSCVSRLPPRKGPIKIRADISRRRRALCRGRQPIQALEPRLLLSQTIDISGTQAAALDQPQIHVIFRDSPNGNPLGGDSPNDGLDVAAFLDTGTSGTLLSQESASALGIDSATYDGQPVQFTDVGIAGSAPFDVSTPLYGNMAPYTTLYGSDMPVSAYTQSFGPISIELNPEPADDLIGPLDIMGMPTMAGKVMVLDPSALAATDPNDFDSLRTYLYSPGTPFDAATADSDPGIPTTNFHVKLSYADFTDYTTTTPSGAPGPTLGDNPFFGPDPLSPAGSNVPPVSISQGSLSASGSFLFDTGSAASFISTAMAASVGVQYQDGTYGSDNPVLVDSSGNPLPNQFVLPIGGIGGTINAAGFFLSSLTLPTQEGDPITFLDAPVLVADVSATNNVTGQTITLDGDLGMNFLLPSIDISGLTGPSSSAASAKPADDPADSAAPFDWITYDQPAGVLGLDIPDLTTSPPPAVTGLTPGTGPAAGGTTVTLTGSGFTGATAVTFGGVAATNLQVISDSEVTATDPAGTGTVEVQVTTPAGNSAPMAADQFTYVAAPAVVNVTPEDNAGNGVAAGSATKGQRSMETQIAVVFSEPVNLAAGAFSLGLVNNYGSGTNNGAPDTRLAGVLGAPANPSGDGETWIIPILSNGTNSYALKGTHGGISGASLNNGVYDLDVTAADVTATGGPAMAANFVSAAWHRLYGDIDNARRVFNTEYSAFLAAFASTYASNGATNYNQDLDYDGDGRVFNTDYAAFLAGFGSTKVYSEPQS
jgi:hypothetical protein